MQINFFYFFKIVVFLKIFVTSWSTKILIVLNFWLRVYTQSILKMNKKQIINDQRI